MELLFHWQCKLVKPSWVGRSQLSSTKTMSNVQNSIICLNPERIKKYKNEKMKHKHLEWKILASEVNHCMAHHTIIHAPWTSKEIQFLVLLRRNFFQKKKLIQTGTVSPTRSPQLRKQNTNTHYKKWNNQSLNKGKIISSQSSRTPDSKQIRKQKHRYNRKHQIGHNLRVGDQEQNPTTNVHKWPKQNM